MNSYTATAHMEAGWWVIDVEGVGITQCRDLRDADRTARDLVASMRNVPASEVYVSVEVSA